MITVLILIPAFYWLLYETYWLTIRLPIGEYPSQNIKIIDLLPIIIVTQIICQTFRKLCPNSPSTKVHRIHHIFKKLLPPQLPQYLR